ncbi:MAG: DUF3019 domain-containing protein [Psychrobium sp.]
MIEQSGNNNNANILLIAALTCAAMVTSARALATSDSPQLSISPSTCIVNKPGEICTSPLQLSWQVPRAMDLCLYVQKERLKCWRNTQQVTEVLVYKLSTSTTFDLKDNTQRVIASSKVNVNSATSKRFRRRLRADWSVF